MGVLGSSRMRFCCLLAVLTLSGCFNSDDDRRIDTGGGSSAPGGGLGGGLGGTPPQEQTYASAAVVGSGGASSFSTPARLLLSTDKSTLYVSDSMNHQIKTIDLASGVVSVVVGNGSVCERFVNPLDTCGDGGPASNATLNTPLGIAFDAAGSKLYIADQLSNLVRVVDLMSGLISTFAGTGASGASGDGGLATAAQLAFPNDVATDQSGSVYIVDTSNNKVRIVDLTGTIRTYAGTGAQCQSVTGGCGDGGQAIDAQLSSPRGILVVESGVAALDGLLIADSEAHKIRRINAAGAISTVVGTGTAGDGGDGGLPRNAQLNTPTDLSITASNTLLIADTGNNQIRSVWIDPVLDVQTASSENQPLDAPQGVVDDPSGTGLLIADSGGNVVRSFADPGGTLHFTACGKRSNGGSVASDYLGLLPGVKAIAVEAWGAAGGGWNTGTGAHGGYARANVNDNFLSLAIFVGCVGHTGSGAGGGGGGATAVTTGEAYLIRDESGILVIAGGGGGNGANGGGGAMAGENSPGKDTVEPVMGNRGNGGKGTSADRVYRGFSGYGGSGGGAGSVFNSPGAGGWGFPWVGNDGGGGGGQGGDQGQSSGGGGGGWGGGGGGWINNEKPHSSGGGGSFSVCEDPTKTSSTSAGNGSVQVQLFSTADPAACSP